MINQGYIKDGKYTKQVDFDKAVLWSARKISLNPDIVLRIKRTSTMIIIFEDQKKNERWTISLPNFMANATLESKFQEKQWYCPISCFKKEPIREEIKPEPPTFPQTKPMF